MIYWQYLYFFSTEKLEQSDRPIQCSLIERIVSIGFAISHFV